MGDKTHITIIMPTGNREDYIATAIDSLLAQTYSEWDLIVADDNTTDRTSEILSEYEVRDSRITVVHGNYGGPGVARNVALNLAKGDIIMFLDSDDMFHPEALERMAKLMSNGCDIAIGKYIEGEKPPKSWLEKKIKLKKIKRYNATEAVKAELYQSHRMNSVWLMAIRREILDSVPQLRFREDVLYEDLEIADRLFGRCKEVIVADLPIYFYRCTPGSIMNTFNRGRVDVLKVMDIIKDRHRDSREDIRKALDDRIFSANYNIYLLIRSMYKKGILGEFSADELIKISEECRKKIRHGRWQAICDRNVRLKNKLGALLSYLRLPRLSSCAKPT